MPDGQTCVREGGREQGGHDLVGVVSARGREGGRRGRHAFAESNKVEILKKTPKEEPLQKK